MANQIPTLVAKELRSHLLTLRLVVALVFTVVLCLLTTWMGSVDYSRSVRAYEGAQQDLREHYEATTVWYQLRPSVIVPPQPIKLPHRYEEHLDQLLGTRRVAP